MRRFLIASHGYLAKGAKATISFFVDQTDNVTYMCGYVDEGDINEKIKNYFEIVDDKDEIIVFTDLMGGSVNSLFLPYLSRKYFHLIAGFNLNLILEFLLLEDRYLSNKEIQQIVSKTKDSIVYVNNFKVTFLEEDDI